MNVYQQYNQQLLQYQYQQLQSANYQHHSGAASFPAAGAVAHAGMYSQMKAAARGPAPAKGKRKKEKDPNRPKRPTSSYFYFIQSARQECKERGEKITRVAEWTKQISQTWRQLTPDEKVPFDVQAVRDKKRYDLEMGRYKNKDPNRPKRPMSAYFLWLADFRERMKDKIPENKELLRSAGEHWKQLTEVEKAPYERRAEEERRKYEVAMREYSQGGGAKKAREDQENAAAALAAGLDLPLPTPTPVVMPPAPMVHMAPVGAVNAKNGETAPVDEDDYEDDDGDDDDGEEDDE